MRELSFWQIFAIGFLLVTTGLVLSWLMVLRIIPASFLVSFIAYGASILGLLVGLVGSASYVAGKRREARSQEVGPLTPPDEPPE